MPITFTKSLIQNLFLSKNHFYLDILYKYFRRRRRYSEDESDTCSVRSVPITLDRSTSSRINNHHHQTSRMSLKNTPLHPLSLSSSPSHISANERAGMLSPPPIRGQDLFSSQSKANRCNYETDINEQKMMQRKISDDCDQLLRDLEVDMAAMSQINGNTNESLFSFFTIRSIIQVNLAMVCA